MFCPKCGTEMVDGKCPNCTLQKNIQKIAYNTYVFVATLATLLIIRLTAQETRIVETPNSWKSSYGTEYYIPWNIQGVMLVLLAVSVYILIKMYDSGKYSKPKTAFMLLAEIVLGVLVTFVRFV